MADQRGNGFEAGSLAPPAATGLARPALQRLRPLDETPAVAWLSWTGRTLAGLPGGTIAAALAVAVAMSLSLLAAGPPGSLPPSVLRSAILPFAAALVAFRIARALVQAARRRLVARGALARAARLATVVADLRALPRTPDGSVVSCVGRVRCRKPFRIAGEPPVAAAIIRFAGGAREDMVVPTRQSSFMTPRDRRHIFNSDNPTGVLLAFLTRPAWVEAAFEVAQDFDLVSEEGGSVLVAACDSQLVVTPAEPLGDVIRADAILAELQAPLAATGASRGLAHLLRDGDTVEIIGFKDTIVSAEGQAGERLERGPPLGVALRGRADCPLLIVPRAARPSTPADRSPPARRLS